MIEHVRNMGIWVIYEDRAQNITTIIIRSSIFPRIMRSIMINAGHIDIEWNYNCSFIIFQSQKQNQAPIVESMIVSHIYCVSNKIFAMWVINVILKSIYSYFTR